MCTMQLDLYHRSPYVHSDIVEYVCVCVTSPPLPSPPLPSPPPDSQSDILKDHLMEELDYSLMPEAAWSKLHVWYGLSEGSRPIVR